MRAVVVNKEFHYGKKWVVPSTGYLIDGLVNKLGCCIVSSQEEYDKIAGDLDWVIATQPGWSAPWIKYKKGMKHKVAMLVSDPHDKVTWLPSYVTENEIDYLLCFMWEATLKFLPTIDKNKIIFFPWTIPDELCVDKIKNPVINDKLMIFGSMNHDAYKLRRWCCNFPFVKKYNKSLKNIGDSTYTEYFEWLGSFGATVCAGSWEYPFVFPKFYEVAASGGLLFGQDVADMQLVGFNSSNCVLFKEDNFEQLAIDYLSGPERYDEIRKNGLKLIQEKHLVSHRLKEIEELMESGIHTRRENI
jgi:hypothetical protein